MKSRRQDDGALLGLIDLVYRAAEAPKLWETFLRSLADALNGRGALFLHHDLLGRGSVATSALLDPAVLHDYNVHFHRLDVLAISAATRALEPGVPATDDMLMPRDQLMRTPYYNEFSLKHNVSRVMSVVLHKGTRMHSGLTLLRGEHDAPYDVEDRRFLRALSPHLQRALQVHQRLQRTDREQAAAIDALDALASAVFIVDAHARVILTNRRGDELLAARDGLTIDDDWRAETSAATKRLRAALAQAIAVTRLQSLDPGESVIVLPRRLGPALRAVITPVSRGRGWVNPRARIGAVVFVIDPANVTPSPAERLAGLFELTRREARVAASFAAARTVDESSVELGIARETVRTHVRRVLAKAGVTTQAQFVRLVTSGVARLGVHDVGRRD